MAAFVLQQQSQEVAIEIISFTETYPALQNIIQPLFQVILVAILEIALTWSGL